MIRTRRPPRALVVHTLVGSAIAAVILSAIVVDQILALGIGQWVIGALACIFLYYCFYRAMDHFYGWYLKEQAKEDAKKEPLVAEIPTCPKCLSVFKSRSFHEPKYEAGWELCGTKQCPFETRPLRPNVPKEVV